MYLQNNEPRDSCNLAEPGNPPSSWTFVYKSLDTTQHEDSDDEDTESHASKLFSIKLCTATPHGDWPAAPGRSLAKSPSLVQSIFPSRRIPPLRNLFSVIYSDPLGQLTDAVLHSRSMMSSSLPKRISTAASAK